MPEIDKLFFFLELQFPTIAYDAVAGSLNFHMCVVCVTEIIL